MSKVKTTEIAEEQVVEHGIDRIRQILFGEQVAEIERHFERLEECIADESIKLRREFTQRLDELAAQLRNELHNISVELENDTKKRLELSELFANISLSLKDKPQNQELG